MKKVFTKLFKTSKIILLLAIVLMTQKVNVMNQNDKLTNENFSKVLDLTAMAFKLNEIQYNDKYAPLDTYTGDLTGYAANCALCTGFLGCTGQDVRNGTTTYYDDTYGELLIVASSKNLPCGSVITFNATYISGDPVYAIVLDRGVTGNDLDLLVESESFASRYIGRHRLTYDVLRFGWSR